MNTVPGLSTVTLTPRERRIIAAALHVSAGIQDALGEPSGDLLELRARIMPDEGEDQ